MGCYSLHKSEGETSDNSEDKSSDSGIQTQIVSLCCRFLFQPFKLITIYDQDTVLNDILELQTNPLNTSSSNSEVVEPVQMSVVELVHLMGCYEGETSDSSEDNSSEDDAEDDVIVETVARLAIAPSRVSVFSALHYNR
jgi:hypothetical protein